MKICILTDAWTPIWGGGQKHIWEVAVRLTGEYDCQIDILVPNLVEKNKKYPEIEEYSDNKLRIIRLGPKFIFPNFLGRIVFLLSCLFWVLSHSYDIIHSHAYQTILFPVIKILQPKKIMVYTVHGAGINMLGGGILNILKIPQTVWQSLLYKFPFDLLITVAGSTITQKPAAKSIVIIPNGVNVNEFDKVSVDKTPGQFKIIWVGRISDPVKGVKFLKEAFVEIKKKHSNVQLALVSNKFAEELIKEYKSSNLFVLPSLSEGLPLTLLEAMAARLPIVATDVGDCKQLVESAQAGIIMPKGDTQALKNAIAEMIGNKNLNRMGKNGYLFVKKNYTWEKAAQKTWEAYNKLV